jgi:hypothetical protein
MAQCGVHAYPYGPDAEEIRTAIEDDFLDRQIWNNVVHLTEDCESGNEPDWITWAREWLENRRRTSDSFAWVPAWLDWLDKNSDRMFSAPDRLAEDAFMSGWISALSYKHQPGNPGF